MVIRPTMVIRGVLIRCVDEVVWGLLDRVYQAGMQPLDGGIDENMPRDDASLELDTLLSASSNHGHGVILFSREPNDVEHGLIKRAVDRINNSTGRKLIFTHVSMGD